MGSVGLPSDLNFALKKSTPQGLRSYRQNVSPIGGINSSGVTDFLKFDLPTGKHGQYVDTSASYLQFTVKAGAVAIYLDASAYCFFQRFTVLSGGQILEDIPTYNNFVTTLLDAQLSPSVRQESASIMMGCGKDSTNQFTNVRMGTHILANTTKTFCIPLVSGIVGANLNKYLPIGAIKNDLRIELQVENQRTAVVCNAINPPDNLWSIVDANMMLQFVDLEADVQKMIDASTGGNYYLSSESWRWYSNNITGTTMSDTIMIPARYSSVKGLLLTMRPSAAQNNLAYSSISYRLNPFAGNNPCSVQFQIGSALYPNAPIRSSAELFAEMQKYFHTLGSTDARGTINSINWNVRNDLDVVQYLTGAAPLGDGDPNTAVNSFPAVPTGAGDYALAANHFMGVGAGFVAINLDQVQNRSDVMNSGLNTLNTNILCNFQYPVAPISTNVLFSAAGSITAGIRVDAYAAIDMVLAIENGVLTVRV